MATAKVAITVDKGLLKELDQLVSKGSFANRSQAITDAIRDKVTRITKGRLLRELDKLNPDEEKDLAEESYKGEDHWPEF